MWCHHYNTSWIVSNNVPRSYQNTIGANEKSCTQELYSTRLYFTNQNYVLSKVVHHTSHA